MSAATQTRPPRAQRADARRNREAVLEAARERFSQEGTAAQIDDIARDAGVGVGTVYRHFATKEDLVEALVEARFARIAEYGSDAVEAAGEDPWGAFSDYMHRSVGLQANDRALSQVMSSHPELMRHHAEASGTWDHVKELVRITKRAGEMRKDADPEDIPMIICGLGLVSERSQAGQGPPGTDWKRFLAITLDGLRSRGATKKLPPAPGR
jgi:AcrR family transcriptional regulator